MALTKLNARSASALDATVLTGNLPAISVYFSINRNMANYI